MEPEPGIVLVAVVFRVVHRRHRLDISCVDAVGLEGIDIEVDPLLTAGNEILRILQIIRRKLDGAVVKQCHIVFGIDLLVLDRRRPVEHGPEARRRQHAEDADVFSDLILFENQGVDEIEHQEQGRNHNRAIGRNPG